MGFWPGHLAATTVFAWHVPFTSVSSRRPRMSSSRWLPSYSKSTSDGNLPLPADFWSALDSMHAADKSGGHADYAEQGRGGFVSQFHSVTRSIKTGYGFGKGLSVARSVSKRFGISWRSPMAPASESTRLVAFESKRIPPNFFHNLRVSVGAVAVSIQSLLERAKNASLRQGHEAREDCGMNLAEVKALRRLGRDILCPQMLLFVSLRYDSRVTGLPAPSQLKLEPLSWSWSLSFLPVLARQDCFGTSTCPRAAKCLGMPSWLLRCSVIKT